MTATSPETDEHLIKQEKTVTAVVWNAADNLLVKAVVWDQGSRKLTPLDKPHLVGQNEI